MSESVAKAERRDIRRAFGERAIGVIDTHGAAILDLQQGGARIAASLRLTHDRHDATEAALKEVSEQQRAFQGRTFRERLRWIVLGR